jgi:SAM-dependent methyltransferase
LSARTIQTTPRALDVGCGAQPFRRQLEALGFAYTGTDAVQNGSGTVDVISLADGPINSDLLARGPFDFLLCTEVLEHVADWRQAFENFDAYLAPGGRLLITAPFYWKLHEEPYDFWRPTLHALNHFARRHDWNVVEQQAGGSAADVLGSIIAQTRLYPVRPGLLARVVQKFFSLCRNGLVWLLRPGRLSRLVRIEGLFYLCNYIVLEKPAKSP